VSVLVEVTGTFGSGEVGASVPLELEGGDAVLLESGESVTLEQTADTTATGEANAPVTGVAATGAVGAVTVDAQAVVPVTGVFGTGRSGRTLVWSSVIPGSDALWLPIGRFVLLLENGDFVLQEPEPGDVVLLEASTDGATWDKIDTNTDDIWMPVAA
jgi:hypothetical protein